MIVDSHANTKKQSEKVARLDKQEKYANATTKARLETQKEAK